MAPPRQPTASDDDTVYRERRAEAWPGWLTDAQRRADLANLRVGLDSDRRPTGGRLLELGCGAGNIGLHLDNAAAEGVSARFDAGGDDDLDEAMGLVTPVQGWPLAAAGWGVKRRDRRLPGGLSSMRTRRTVRGPMTSLQLRSLSLALIAAVALPRCVEGEDFVRSDVPVDTAATGDDGASGDAAATGDPGPTDPGSGVPDPGADPGAEDPDAGVDAGGVDPDAGGSPCVGDGPCCVAGVAAADGTPCAEDGVPCTEDVCAAGACTHAAQAGWCAIDGGCFAEGTASPANPCLSCDASASSTAWQALGDGAPCDDGNACTVGDACAAGACAAGEAVTCTAKDGCHVVGTCDPGSGVCNNPPAPNETPCGEDGSGDTCEDGQCLPPGCVCTPGTACCDCQIVNEGGGCEDDGVSCTDDVCASGLCTHAPSTGLCLIAGTCVADGDEDPANPCRWCDPAANATGWTLKPQGAACDDGDACTAIDTCTGGTCAGGSPVVCLPADGCHGLGVCAPETGLCSKPVKEDGTGCDDGDPCTLDDACSAATCQGTPRVCAAPAACQTGGSCSSATGECEYVAAMDGTSCDDGNPATGNDQCHSGVCKGDGCDCGAQDACCDGCFAVNVGSSCGDDGIACTDDACTAEGTCATTLQAGRCLIGGVCYDEGAVGPNGCLVCSPAASGSGWTVKANGAACDDGDPCTLNDACSDGSCAGAFPPWPAPDELEATLDPTALTPLGDWTNDQPNTPRVSGWMTWFTEVGPAGPTTFHNSADGDHFYWVLDHQSNDGWGAWVCRVSGLQPGQMVNIWMAADAGGDYYPGAWYDMFGTYTGDQVADDGGNAWAVVPGISLPKGWYIFAAGVLPLAGHSACHSSYSLSCKLNTTGLW